MIGNNKNKLGKNRLNINKYITIADNYNSMIEKNIRKIQITASVVM